MLFLSAREFPVETAKRSLGCAQPTYFANVGTVRLPARQR
jgi:hypothetical protein